MKTQKQEPAPLVDEDSETRKVGGVPCPRVLFLASKKAVLGFEDRESSICRLISNNWKLLSAPQDSGIREL